MKKFGIIFWGCLAMSSFSSLAHKAEENSHGCHDGKLSYHCHGKAIAETKNTTNRKIVVQPEILSTVKVVQPEIKGPKRKVIWKEGYLNRKPLMIKEIKDLLSDYYGEKLEDTYEVTTDTIKLIVRFQTENRMIKDGIPSEKLFKMLKKNIGK